MNTQEPKEMTAELLFDIEVWTVIYRVNKIMKTSVIFAKLDETWTLVQHHHCLA